MLSGDSVLPLEDQEAALCFVCHPLWTISSSSRALSLCKGYCVRGYAGTELPEDSDAYRYRTYAKKYAAPMHQDEVIVV